VGYRDGLMLFISGDFSDPATFERRLEESLIGIGLSKSDLIIGRSGIYDALEGLNYAVREAVWAQMGAEAIVCTSVQAQPLTAFRDIGIYQLLLPMRDTNWCDRYVHSFLSPLMNKDDETGSELLKTAIAYITCSGQLKQTAQMLFVHENTVRYRINSIHKRLCPTANELIFYEQLSAAIRLYVLKTQNRCI
jgi:DNA-binding PucR family transcriptional regulator